MNNVNTDIGIVQIVVMIAVYLFVAYCINRIGHKAGFAHQAWWGWVPILQVLLLLKVAGVAWWWIFLFLIPLVNLIIGAIVWMKIAERLAKPKWLGVAMIIPIFDLFVLGYLALSK